MGAREYDPHGGPYTAILRHYNAVKAQYPRFIVLYQVGDFFEIFGDDANTTANVLGLVLTHVRDEERKLVANCGISKHYKDHYAYKLVNAGYPVVVISQIVTILTGVSTPTTSSL